MAKTIGYSSEVVTGQIVEAPHVSQSIEAFSAANQQDYDISVSGSFKVTGSQFIKPDTLLQQTKTYVLSYDNTTGQIFKMPSSAGGSGGGVYRTGSSISNIIPLLFGVNANKASGSASAIASGDNNFIQSDSSFVFIGGGCDNSIITGSKSSIIGGSTNTIKAVNYNACNNFIGTPQTSFISAQFGFIGSGNANKISGSVSTGAQYSAIVNGSNNHITGSGYSFIGSGLRNKINDTCNSFIGTGNDNNINSCFSFIGSGIRNITDDSLSIVVSGFQNTSSGEFSTIVNGACQLASGGCTFIGNGIRNTASAALSVVVGGNDNVADGQNSFIGGGDRNRATSTKAIVVGGQLNTASVAYSFVGGGLCNNAAGVGCNVIVGGCRNDIQACNSFIGGGTTNTINISGLGGYGIIIGGISNCIDGSSKSYNFIGNGSGNCIIQADGSVIGSGASNKITKGSCNAIITGFNNCVETPVGTGCSAILTGRANKVTTAHSMIGSGCNNIITGSTQCYNFIGTGCENIISSSNYSSIVGGVNNSSSASCSFIGGGCLNVIEGGGSLNNIVGGQRNIISSSTATFNTSIVGGLRNTASGACSFIGGGEKNFVSSSLGTIVGGFTNTLCGYEGIQGCGNSILGGSSNIVCAATGSLRANNTIAGGASNCILKYVHDSFIGGGTFLRICGEGTGGASGCTKATKNNALVGGCSNSIIDKEGSSEKNAIIGGGSNSIISDQIISAPWESTKSNSIMGGNSNAIHSKAKFLQNNAIHGGNNNLICGVSNSFIAGGINNSISGSQAFYSQLQSSTILGGKGNQILTTNTSNVHNLIGGGNGNRITGSNNYSSIIGGYQNRVYASTSGQVFGGCLNTVCSSNFSSIIGGQNNIVAAGHNSSAIIATDNKTTTAANTLYTCNVCAFGNLNISGTANAAVKSFRIPHPDPEKTATYELWHTSIESPTAGDTMYRFSITTENNEAEIILPEYYRYLNENTQLWVSADGHFGKAFGIVNLSSTKIKVTSNEDGKYNVMVVGTRKDKEATASWKGAERLKNNL